MKRRGLAKKAGVFCLVAALVVGNGMAVLADNNQSDGEVQEVSVEEASATSETEAPEVAATSEAEAPEAAATSEEETATASATITVDLEKGYFEGWEGVPSLSNPGLEGTDYTLGFLPTVVANEGYTFTGWKVTNTSGSL